MTPGAIIAHYRIVSKLGEGGMGAVYRATDTKLHRDVAIKILSDALAQRPRLRGPLHPAHSPPGLAHKLLHRRRLGPRDERVRQIG